MESIHQHVHEHVHVNVPSAKYTMYACVHTLDDFQYATAGLHYTTMCAYNPNDSTTIP